jgi:hypothetical protein
MDNLNNFNTMIENKPHIKDIHNVSLDYNETLPNITSHRPNIWNISLLILTTLSISIFIIYKKGASNFISNNTKDELFKIIAISSPFIGAVSILPYISRIMVDDNVWITDPKNIIDEKRIERTVNRGKYVSLTLLSLFIVQFGLKQYGASEGLLVLFYGLMFRSLIGFLGDQAIGTDDGLEEFKKSNIGGMKYMFGKVATSSFFRFILTVLLNMFISTPIHHSINYFVSDSMTSLTNKEFFGDKYDGMIGVFFNLIGKNHKLLVRLFVSVITFMAYANQTRFAWAYASPTIMKEKLISTDIIKLAISISSIVFLVAVYPSINVDYSYSTKLMFVLLAFILLTLGSRQIMYNIDPMQEYSVDKKIDDGELKFVVLKNDYLTVQDIKNKSWVGLLMFMVISIICIFIPVYQGTNNSFVKSIGISSLTLLISMIILFIIIMIGKKRTTL